jgi:predicted ATP-grasp superfamily ATP-dependent carboligase
MAALVDAAVGIEAPALVYGAGLENRPQWVARLSQGRELLGNPPDVLRRVRDPRLLGTALREGGHPFPTTLAPGDAPPDRRRRRWLRKPLRGGGGRGIRGWRGGALRGEEVLQERIAGLPCSAAAVGDGRTAELLGVGEQLIGERALGASGHGWCGNLFPARLPEDERGSLARSAAEICQRLAAAFGLRGLFGVDLVWDGERAWTVEVNPRPTGSLEAIEELSPVGSFERHLASIAGSLDAPPAPPPGRAAGKAIVFAPADCAVRDSAAWDEPLAASPGSTPAGEEVSIRDLPHPGEPIRRGAPVCTLVGTGRSPQEVHALLGEAAARLAGELLLGTEAHVAG